MLLLAGASARIEIIDYEEGMTASSTEDKTPTNFKILVEVFSAISAVKQSRPKSYRFWVRVF